MPYIIGINAFHGDASACILKNGQLVAAAEEERFRRIKHWAGFPVESIKYCLDEAGITIRDLGHLAINSNPKANIGKKIVHSIKCRNYMRLAIDRIVARNARAGILELIGEIFPEDRFKGKLHNIEHHLSHMASGFYPSQFNRALVVSVDGLGDFASAAWGVGEGARINDIGRIYFPHSLGIFYEAMTHYLGFKNYGDEYKVMGLAPYGKPRYLKQIRKLVCIKNDGTFKLNLDYFTHHLGKAQHKWDGGVPVSGDCFGEELSELLGVPRKDHEELTQRHMDIARSTQETYEQVFFHLLNILYKQHGIEDLALSGGCAMNSVANGKIYRNTPFKRVYIQSAAGDAGGAIGAAFSVWYSLNPDAGREYVMDHAYYGPQFSNVEISSVLKEKHNELMAENCVTELISNESDLCGMSAQAISEGKVIGWFQGRMEWGPRALGNRSILCDPRRSDMKDVLNLKIKRRESFRPFAPSILREHVSEWFEEDDDVPFMMKVFQIKKEKRELIPAVTHVDGSGRLQTVTRDTNPRYFGLIEAFRDVTGIPILLNTSFNENEPVVCRPEEALACFLRTKMDVLVLGNYIITRS